MFQHVDAYAGDPILSLNEAFQKDPRAGKINLSIGIYFDNDGRIPMLPSVRAAELAVVEAAGARPYLPMEGAANFRSAVQALLFGAEHPAIAAGRIVTIQGVGSSGGLKVGADLLKRYFPDSKVYLSDPTWDNHRAVFEGSGHVCETYPYYDAATGGLRFDELLARLKALPARSIVVLHACCHNPTGYDISAAQWAQVVATVKAKGLTPFLDMAYQGFGFGLKEDGEAVRQFLAAGLGFFVSTSFSKSFSLYGERVGALSVVCTGDEEAVRVLSQLKIMIRTNYSNPPTHGAQVVAQVLADDGLRGLWEEELAGMRVRIKAMRSALVAALKAAGVTQDLGFVTEQLGMFSYSGLSATQMQRLRSEFGVYGVDSGRICVAALNEGNLPTVAAAMAAVIKG